jgi:hypothetical protein
MESGQARLHGRFARRSSPSESARGLAHSKTLRVVGSRRNSRQRPGLRRPSAAFPRSAAMVEDLAAACPLAVLFPYPQRASHFHPLRLVLRTQSRSNRVPTGFHHTAQGCPPSLPPPSDFRLHLISARRVGAASEVDSPARTESARGLAHSKTLRVVGSRRNSRQRPGLRRPSAAFPGARLCRRPAAARPFDVRFPYLQHAIHFHPLRLALRTQSRS